MSVNELPPEILQLIFERVVGIPGRYRPLPFPQQALCSACRIWRSIALQDPLLWNTLHLPNSEGALRYMECFLQRSAAAPLDIYIAMGNKSRHFWSLKKVERCTVGFIELIVGESHRWRMLELRVPHLFMDLKPLRSGEAPMLETLVLSMHPDRDRDPYLTPLPPLLFPGSNLASLTVARVTVRWDQWNCKTITDLTLGPFDWHEGPSLADLAGILSTLSRRLRTLSIQGGWMASTDESARFGPITLSSLTSFVTSNWGWPFQDILRGCSFPVLDHVDLSIPYGYSPIISHICSQPRLFQSVKRLTIMVETDTRTSVCEVLRHAFPQVYHITLSRYSKVDALSSAVVSTWASVTRIDLLEAGLTEVREFLSKRSTRCARPLQELNLEVARGPLYRADYDWIGLNVDRFLISLVQPDHGSFLGNGDAWPFEERYLLADRAQRTPPEKFGLELFNFVNL